MLKHIHFLLVKISSEQKHALYLGSQSVNLLLTRPLRTNSVRPPSYLSRSHLQSVKKYSGTTKNIKGKDFKSPSPLNQCCKNREREKIKNCTCFDNQQH